MGGTLHANALSRAPGPAGPRRGVVVGIGAAVLVALAAVIIWLVTRDEGPSEPPAFDSACGTVVRPEGRVQARVLLVGDSLLAQPSCELAAALAADGVATHLHAIGGSGLLTGVDWQKRFQRLLDAVHPDAVVGLFVGNYLGGPLTDLSGQPIPADSELFFALWQQRAAELSQRAQDAGVRMFWVEPPPLEDGGRARRLFDGYASLGDATLPSGRALAGPDGGWVESKPGCLNGAPLRNADGVHLTPDGAHVFARALAHDIAGALDLPAIAPVC